MLLGPREGKVTHRRVSTRKFYHTSWTSNGGSVLQAEGTADAKTNTGTNLVCSTHWKKGDTAAGKGRVAGDRARQEGRDETLWLQDP